jgi:hypothetical protein
MGVRGWWSCQLFNWCWVQLKLFFGFRLVSPEMTVETGSDQPKLQSPSSSGWPRENFAHHQLLMKLNSPPGKWSSPPSVDVHVWRAWPRAPMCRNVPTCTLDKIPFALRGLLWESSQCSPYLLQIKHLSLLFHYLVVLIGLDVTQGLNPCVELQSHSG